MKTRKIKFTIPEYREKKEIFEALGYQELSKKEKGYKVSVIFQIDDKNKNYKEIRELDRLINAKGPNFLPIVGFLICSFILLSVFVIRLAQSVRDGQSFDLVNNALSFLLPAFTFMLLDVIYTYFYFKMNQKIIARGKYTASDVKEMVKKINKINN